MLKDCDSEDKHSSLIQGYKKTFRRLAAMWFANGVINEDQRNEIIALVKSSSWNIWRPQLYIICRIMIGANRLLSVPAINRAAIPEEWQIKDLDSSEFEIIERVR